MIKFKDGMYDEFDLYLQFFTLCFAFGTNINGDLQFS